MWLIFIFTLAIIYLLVIVKKKQKTIDRLNKENNKLKELLEVQDKLLNL